MSKIGKKIITIPSEVQVSQKDGILEFKGKGGNLTVKILPFIEAKMEGNTLSFNMKEISLQAQANWGTTRALAQNAIIGVSEGFKKTLEISGIGFRASVEKDDLVLNVGFSHPVRFKIPTGIKITIEKSFIVISGIDKYLVGETAAKIRKIKKPEPYKGTGIKYKDEIIRRKAGKKVAGATGTAA